MLIGERAILSCDQPNFAVPGIDEETTLSCEATGLVDLAAFQLYADVGLKVNVDVAVIGVMHDEDAFHCEHPDEHHQLHWVLFMCCDAGGENHPGLMTQPGSDTSMKLKGTRWVPLNEVASLMSPPWRTHVASLIPWASTIIDRRCACAEAVDLSGLWTRESSRNVGVMDGLMARGLSAEAASHAANKPYVQRWQPADDSEPSGSWVVTTFGTPQTHSNGEPCIGARCLVYPLGDWNETYEGPSVLFGPSPAAKGATRAEGQLLRRTWWIDRKSVV